MGPDRLKSMRKYLALFDLQKLTDKDSYRRVIDELVATLPSATKQEIMRTMSRHLQFVMSDKYRSPLRRRTMASERPRPGGFASAGRPARCRRISSMPENLLRNYSNRSANNPKWPPAAISNLR